MRKIFVLGLLCVLTIGATAQKLEPFQLFSGNGKKVSFKKMLKKLNNKQVILFGEYHDDAIAHWVQLELTKALFQKDSNLVLGAEMFERNTQQFLDLYLTGELNARQFADTVPSMWNNYKTDYAPLVNFAKNHNLSFVATNIPRYLATAVYRGGFAALDTLPKHQQYMMAKAPIPYDATLPGYKAMLEMGGGHGGPNLPMAQAIKDATMAESIVAHTPQNGTMLHFNGSYHSNNYEGIYWYLKQYKPELTIGTITTVRQSDLKKLHDDNKGLADYVLVVNDDMTRTY